MKNKMKDFNMSATITPALELSLLPNSILLLLYFVLLLLYFYVAPPLENQTPSGRAIRQLIFGLIAVCRLRLPELSPPPVVRAIVLSSRSISDFVYECLSSIECPPGIRAILRLRLAEHSPCDNFFIIFSLFGSTRFFVSFSHLGIWRTSSFGFVTNACTSMYECHSIQVVLYIHIRLRLCRTLHL